MPEPSFYQLFRRSKYSRFEFDGAPTADHNRRELFAVAALALALKHDEGFRGHFLKTICEIHIDASEFEVRCEEFPCADLALLQRSRENCCIVEAKVKADLDRKQDPGTPEFESGYAGQIAKCFRGYRQRKYVVLTQQGTPECRDVGELKCLRKTWANLLPGLTETPLITDLLNSLGKLQISAFEVRKFQGKPMANKTLAAADLFRFFAAIAGRLGIEEHSIKWDVSNDENLPFFGFDIRPKQAEFPAVKDRLDYVITMWLGYEFETQTGAPEARVWFYCNTEQERQALEGLVVDENSKFIRNDKARFSVGPVKAAENEADWFLGVMRKLGAGC